MFTGLVNNRMRKSSQMTQNFFHNNTKRFLMDTEALKKFVATKMRENELTAREVEKRAKRAGYQITHSHVNKIKNGKVKNPTTPILEAIAAGIGSTATEVIAITLGTK